MIVYILENWPIGCLCMMSLDLCEKKLSKAGKKRETRLTMWCKVCCVTIFVGFSNETLSVKIYIIRRPNIQYSENYPKNLKIWSKTVSVRTKSLFFEAKAKNGLQMRVSIWTLAWYRRFSVEFMVLRWNYDFPMQISWSVRQKALGIKDAIANVK